MVVTEGGFRTWGAEGFLDIKYLGTADQTGQAFWCGCTVRALKFYTTAAKWLLWDQLSAENLTLERGVVNPGEAH